MNTLIKYMLVFALALLGANASAQCTLSGYAFCSGSDKYEYSIVVDISNAQVNDIVSILSDKQTVIEGIKTLTFGPFHHSGNGLAHQEVKLNGVSCIEILETLCGFKTYNGLHASGAGCINIDNRSTGYILAQSQPGTFQNNDEVRQIYILSNANDEFITYNSHGLFTELDNKEHQVRAVNVRTSEANDFGAGLTTTTDLPAYLNTSCIAVCGAVSYNVECTDSEIVAKVDPNFTDPCDCRNPKNIYESDGSIRYVHDLLEISLADPNDTWVIRNPTTTFYFESSPGVIEEAVDGTIIPYVGNNEFQLDIYHTSSVGWGASIEAINGPNTSFLITEIGNICDCMDAQIPAIGFWALINLGMLLCIIGIIKIRNRSSVHWHNQ